MKRWGVDRKAKYRALAKLKEAGLVSTRRVGNQSIEVTLLHTNGLIPGYEE
jgi:DNA-binding transcriptional ArsR family regulator